MISAADKAQIMDALMGAKYPGVRIYLLTEAGTTSTGHVPLEFDGRTDGLLKRGRELTRRRLQDGETVIRLDVAMTRGRMGATFRAVRAFAVFARGATTGERHLVRPNGIAMLTETVMSFTGAGRVEAYELPAVAGDYLITSGGDTLVTSGGDSLVWS
jgi:hypothetical protein